MKTLELPWPPSINHYYRNFNGRTIISKEGREYRDIVMATVRGSKKMLGRLSMKMDLYPPDLRRRDIDNVQKALWDALQHGGVYQDDSQIKHFEVDMREPMPPHGTVIVHLTEQ